MNNDNNTNIGTLKKAVDTFVKDRDWQQFHTPKNLSMAIAIEAAELMEEFRFMSSNESLEVVKRNKEKVAHEIADVVIAALSFCNLYDIDLTNSVEKKLAHNSEKYPIHKAKGSYKKYSEHT